MILKDYISEIYLIYNNLIILSMKKINLRGISEILSEKEMKNVMGGSAPIYGGLGNSCAANALLCSGNCTLSGGGSGYCSTTHIDGIPICWCYEG